MTRAKLPVLPDPSDNAENPRPDPSARSYVVYRGPSRYDARETIRGVLVMHSANVKTGDMVQLFILHDETAPHVAIKTGEDQSVCGSCPFRPALEGGCYVTTFQGPLSTWRSTRGRKVNLPSALAALRQAAGERDGHAVLRLGAYGDVAALPAALVSQLVSAVDGRVTGYTHGHRLLGLAGVAHLRTSCMLSVESEEDARTAWANGWRTFRGVSPEASEANVPGREITCPTEYRDIQCDACGLCKGASLQARSITIPVHGATVKRALRVVSAA